MIYSRYHACAICIALAAAIGAAGQGSPSQNPSIAAASSDVQLITIDLSDTPFNSVQVCWPINTLIQPGSNYSLELQAQTAVLQALTWDVSNSSLQLSTNSSFRSLYPIVAIVRLAAIHVFLLRPKSQFLHQRSKAF
ncbi:hypothetical protein CVIRNUC_000782 [Coccomyxa viridis]|uniref:Extracellular protein n=1 Tax=Coccomyxa viridis TaxID=1274662 RepID=A0AAV1HU47_9CHLO|nr:hypothetical protein CVIRNUC_000782 [Coccomyxa viridis]